MKILAFAATNHKESINKKLVTCVTSMLKKNVLPNAEIEILDLIDYELPLYRQDREQTNGIPELATAFYQKITNSDAVIVSFAEHNGSYTAVYKNLFDWASRISMQVYQNKPMILMATSLGKSGAASVLRTATDSASFFGMNLLASLHVPLFNDQYDHNTGQITNQEIHNTIQDALLKLIS